MSRFAASVFQDMTLVTPRSVGLPNVLFSFQGALVDQRRLYFPANPKGICTLPFIIIAVSQLILPSRKAASRARMAPSILNTPTEIRGMIYEHLFPQIYLPPYPVSVEIYRTVFDLDLVLGGRLKWTYNNFEPDVDLSSDISAVQNLLITSRFFYLELSQLLHHAIRF